LLLLEQFLLYPNYFEEKLLLLGDKNLPIQEKAKIRLQVIRFPQMTKAINRNDNLRLYLLVVESITLEQYKLLRTMEGINPEALIMQKDTV